ncbi:unnamed protein product, partial [Rhizoctonia solani]
INCSQIIPVRCFTCGKVIGDKWEDYVKLLRDDVTEGDAMDQLGLKRYCCRRMVLTHVDLIEKLLQYNRASAFRSFIFSLSPHVCSHGANKRAHDARRLTLLCLLLPPIVRMLYNTSRPTQFDYLPHRGQDLLQLSRHKIIRSSPPDFSGIDH